MLSTVRSLKQNTVSTIVNHVFEFSNVSAYRGGTKVFEGLDLSIRMGESTAILGPNGSGKTTLLKLISREIYPVHADDCRMTVYGRDRWNVEELRSRLGIVSHDLQQNYGVYAKGREVMLSGYYSSIDTWPHQLFSATDIERAEELMRQLGVEELADRPFGKMSTGQQRRFLLGRALVHGPEALLLDEPTSGLDISASFQYLDTVRKLMQQGTQLILVTHHIHEIPPEVTRVIFMRKGRVVADGDKEAMLTSSNVSSLFGCGVELIERNGYYQAVPAG
ncbi:MAG TPA: ABC transporter ATP-binding protein [Chlorobaculum sp.]|uniref:ABC transporter, ATP-binding protein n=1 Tax=Chlorobaculum tepidum (strain ATCC 49652 / DSM 12025 / NBRC 103806 / TLS) TaxID=194439 RepID=Q8KED6_CHLTE|nr:ABC transporter, ATP-binding protein [Chlorobaculum tepidum TLS]HBU22910.1 ABC transporter ATP-binding protein [Chlorobaculum sp.]